MTLFTDASQYRHKKAGYNRFCRDTQTLYNQAMENTASEVDVNNFIRLSEAEERLFRVARLIMLDFSKPEEMCSHPHAAMERIRNHFRNRLASMPSDTHKNICPTAFHRRDRLLVRHAILEHWKREREVHGKDPMTPAETNLRFFMLNILTCLPLETDTDVPPGATPAQVWESLVDHVQADPHLNMRVTMADGTAHYH
ncbi:hypothetical protein SLS58_002149 [Diplodia intermedia]|uniref:Uncharacterized protein n=1 Tax=Diplodia intermedia TaxID=856260 RepID=A0ABR3TZR4_9PEZI